MRKHFRKMRKMCTIFIFIVAICIRSNCAQQFDGYDVGQAVPRDVIVNVINNFGLELLQAHNDNKANTNLALSPYGAASVLIAVGEGVTGIANEEIRHVLRLPTDLSVVRIGLRDVHRHLKSYFIPKEGFLAGLTLSHENVTLTERFEEILRFYGYDIESFNNAVYPDFERDNGVEEDQATEAATTTTSVEEHDETATTSEEVVTTVKTTTPKRSTTTTKKETMMTTRVPSTSKKPSTTTRKPSTTTQKSSKTTQKSLKTTQKPSTTTESRQTTTGKPRMTTEEPQTTTEEPQTTTEKPQTTTEKLRMTTEEPQTKEEPQTRTEKPQTTTDTVPMTTEEPQTTIEEEQTTTEMPQTTTEKLPMTTEEPQTTQGPQVTTKQLKTTTERPRSTKMARTPTELPKSTTEKSKITTNRLQTTTKSADGKSIDKTMEPTEKISKSTTFSTNPTVTMQKLTSPLILTQAILSTTKFAEPTTTEKEIVQTSTEIGQTSTEIEQSSTDTFEAEESSTITESSAATTQVLSTAFDLVNETTQIIPTTTESVSSTQGTSKTDVIDEEAATETSTIKLDELTTDVSELEEDMTTVEVDSSHQKTTSQENLMTSSAKRLSSSSKRNVKRIAKITVRNLEKNARKRSTSSYVDGIASATQSSRKAKNKVDDDSNGRRSSVPRSMLHVNQIVEDYNLLMKPAIVLNGRRSEERSRGKRSVVDYVIARYYDNYYSTNNNDGSSGYATTDEDRFSFLTNGNVRLDDIDYMAYDTVLPFAFVPQLNALALGFPLDNIKYYLLLLLPIDATGIDRLIYDLNAKKNLREIVDSLKYARVKATIPSFMLKGYVVLTPTLQKLGVNRIFEPRQADFSPMTVEKDTYVTNMEQAITVTIRNYVDPKTLMSNYRHLHEYGLVEFNADHPFLYFVMDSDIHVTLMAGKIINPLNSRIR